MHRGTTLPELLLVVALLGVLLALGASRVAAATDAARVRTATARLLGAVEAARGTALRLGRPATLHLGGARWEVRVPGLADSVAWGGEGHAPLGVAVGGIGAPIAFGAAGLATGVANRTFELSRGGVTRRVVLSRLGRVR